MLLEDRLLPITPYGGLGGGHPSFTGRDGMLKGSQGWGKAAEEDMRVRRAAKALSFHQATHEAEDGTWGLRR